MVNLDKDPFPIGWFCIRIPTEICHGSYVRDLGTATPEKPDPSSSGFETVDKKASQEHILFKVISPPLLWMGEDVSYAQLSSWSGSLVF